MIFSPSASRDASSFILDQSPERDMGKARKSDRILLVSVVMLMAVGVLAVFSSIAYFAELKQTTATSLILGHLTKLGFAVFVMILFSKVDYHIVIRFAKIGLLVSWGLLLFVTLFGTEVWGAKRSVNLGGFSFQPSSMAMVSLLMYLVHYAHQTGKDMRHFSKGFMPAMVYVGITCALIAVEDFSSAAVLGGMAMLILFVAEVPARYLATLVLIGALGGATFIGSSSFRQARIASYIDQITDIKSDSLVGDNGYQAQQAHIAIARGGLIGVGIGKSSQRDFLPAPYNDFIYAIIAEEYGLLGSMLVLLLYTLILIRGVIFVARQAFDSIGRQLAVACTIGIVTYAYVNAAVATGLFPVTGLPMPFVSYGGSSMVFSGILMGVLLNISKTRRAEE
jgi:cell division protein FtsW